MQNAEESTVVFNEVAGQTCDWGNGDPQVKVLCSKIAAATKYILTCELPWSRMWAPRLRERTVSSLGLAYLFRGGDPMSLLNIFLTESSGQPCSDDYNQTLKSILETSALGSHLRIHSLCLDRLHTHFPLSQVWLPSGER